VHSVPGNSDWRIDEIGDQVLRTRSDPRPLCRYSNCPELTVNGGDQQPESANFINPNYKCDKPVSGQARQVACGASWRGDLSSAAQLVFDSTNWADPQVVTVTARDDDVYEPEVNNRGQDAYVHHFVVAQDINLEHTYYDDLEVNDLTVSITDDDPAVVIEDKNDATPTEGGPDSRIRLRLASEPMYPVTVYLQSGSFFTPGETPACTTTGTGQDKKTSCNFKPDDEQVIFQDEAQYHTCWTTNSTVRTYTYPLVRDQTASYRAAASTMDHGGTFNYQGCFENEKGEYALVNAPIDVREPSPLTRQIPATMQCHGDDRCEGKDQVGLPNGAYPRDNYLESREAIVTSKTCQISDCANVKYSTDEVGHYVETGQEAGTRDDNAPSSSSASTPIGRGGSTAAIDQGTAMRSCKWDGEFLTLRTYSSDGISHLPTTGYTCNSYVTFSTTNWNTWQALRVIGVGDDLDEGNYRISEIGFLYESIDYYYNSAGSKLITSHHMTYKPTEDLAVAGTKTDRDSRAATVDLSMFDTRFGKHINRYPRVANSDDLDAVYSGADQKLLNTKDVKDEWISDNTSTATRTWEGPNGKDGTEFHYLEANGGGAGFYGTPAMWGTPCHGNSDCTRKSAFHTVDAENQVCCCEVPVDGASMDWFLADTASGHAQSSYCGKKGDDDKYTANHDDCKAALTAEECSRIDVQLKCQWQGVVKALPISFSSTSATAGVAEDKLQVQTFAPKEYATRMVECGAKVTVTDSNTRGVTISRSVCEATEGRRFWFDTFQQEPTPMECDMDGRLYQRIETKPTKTSNNAAVVSKVAPMEITLGLFTAERAADNTYQAPSYKSFADTIKAINANEDGFTELPSSGTIEGDLGYYYGICLSTGVPKSNCVSADPVCIEGGNMSQADTEKEMRYACEHDANKKNGIFVPKNKLWSSVNNGTCYDAGVATKKTCEDAGNTWVAGSNNQAGVNNNLTVATNTSNVGEAGKLLRTDASSNSIVCPSANADGWTMTDWPDAEYRGMTAPVCPYTIVLDATPLEGATVVVHLREDFETSNLRDHELFFYEEASYRPGVAWAECKPALYPGSSWVNGGCFIHNVPVNKHNVPIPRGNVDLDVMFTDADWNIPRRITAIALNDDVDEPTELRTIYHTVGTCQKFNHNNDEVCQEDPTYTGIAVDPVKVIVQDDDIADLVVIADDGYVCAARCEKIDGSALVSDKTTAAGCVEGDLATQNRWTYSASLGECTRAEPNIIDESFIGSYDAAGPRLALTVNYWYQAFERQGPFAEDGISGSNFQGRSVGHGDPRSSKWAVSKGKDTTLQVWHTPFPGKCQKKGQEAATAKPEDHKTEKECLANNGADPAKQNEWIAAVPAHCEVNTGDNQEIKEGEPHDNFWSWTEAQNKEACESSYDSWPIIDPGNARGKIYKTGVTADGKAVLASSFYGHGVQRKNDGIGAGGFRHQSQTGMGSVCDGIEKAELRGHTGKTGDNNECQTNKIEEPVRTSITGGYITDNEDPLCINPDPLKQDDRCFRIDNQPWTNYDPYWDIYTGDSTNELALVSYDSAQPRHVYDSCTPVGQLDTENSPEKFKTCDPGRNSHPQPNRGFKGIGPAYTEPDDEFAITVHSRECRHDTFGDAPAFWGKTNVAGTSLSAVDTTKDTLTDTKEAGWEHGSQSAGADAYRAAPGDVEPGAYGEGTDLESTDCIYGTFKVRLNSSPGTKHVRRRYVGETDTVLEEELVHVVITPDVTPQTMFDPVSVTFTSTGGEVDGKDTYRWDEPALFKVVPVDDEVDERAGVEIDFTSFTVTQSHFGDAYWDYTNKYQAQDSTGTMKVPSATTTSSNGRADAHTPYRHHIRTIHTRDNDFAGVTIESGVSDYPGRDGAYPSTPACYGADVCKGLSAGACGAKPMCQFTTMTQLQEAAAAGAAWGAKSGDARTNNSNVNYNSHSPITLSVTEGETFAFYTLRLDSQPRKVQRQAGTNPNNIIVKGTKLSGGRLDYYHHHNGGRVAFIDDTLHTDLPTLQADKLGNGEYVFDGDADPAGMYHALHTGKTDCDFEDFSDVTRPHQCGSVEPEQTYWVDVTTTQSIHVDLAEPGSCPEKTPWGGGKSPATSSPQEHARFPFNAKLKTVDNKKVAMPINELTSTADHLDAYLPTCGGWQRDATYRFTAANWNVPQYVYLYAHNDKDSAKHVSNSKSRAEGGNDGDGDGWSLGQSGNSTGGNEAERGGRASNSTANGGIITLIKHYVETEDTLDNMDALDNSNTEIIEGYVQRNKHGGQYTSGNNERYPFGMLTDHMAGDTTGQKGASSTGTTLTDQPLTGVDSMQEAILTEPFGHRVTGFTTYGYSDYQWLYGYYEQDYTWTGVHIGLKSCGAVHMGAGIGHAQSHTNADNDDPSNVGDLYVWGYESTDADDAEHVHKNLSTKALPNADPTKWANGYVEPFSGEYCLDPFDNNKPYTQDGKHCIPVRVDHPLKGGNQASPGLSGAAAQSTAFARQEAVRTSPGPNYFGVGPSTAAGDLVSATGAENSWPTSNTKSDADKTNANGNSTSVPNTGIELAYCVPKYATKNGGMKHKPADVSVIIMDNDIIAAQGAISNCRQTSLFSSSAIRRTSSESDPFFGNEWLTDYNCKNGDGGGLPGYPVAYAAVAGVPIEAPGYAGDANVPGDEQCTPPFTGPKCSDNSTETSGR